MNVSQRAARGAQLLDENVPDWYNRIDLETLNVEHLDYCIIGQLFDVSYKDALGQMGIDIKAERDYGFDVLRQDGWDKGWDAAYAELQQEWIGQINARKSGPGSTTA